MAKPDRRLTTFFRELFGRDSRAEIMRALHDLDKARAKLHSIVGMGIFENSFDDERHRLMKEIDALIADLRNGVIYGGWWEARDKAMAASKTMRAGLE